MKEWYVGEIRKALTRPNLIGRYGLEAFPPAILSCAITGGFHGKSANPNLPVFIEEQVQQTVDAYNAGAVVVHIHTRDPQNPDQMDRTVESYREINARIRERCPDIIINNTYIGMRNYPVDGTASPPMSTSLKARPEVASLDVSAQLQLNSIAAMNLSDLEAHLKAFDEYGIKPEMECFSLADLKNVQYAIAKGLLKPPYWIQIIYGGFGAQPSLESLQLAEKLVPDESLLSIIGIGAAQTAFLAYGLLMGHHVRVGLEDNVYYSKGVLAESNAQLVERAVRIARDLGRPLATPAQAREIMGLGAPREYTF